MVETKMNILINPEHEALLPKLPKHKYEALKLSIKNEGVYYPIIANPEGPEKLLEKKFVIEVNLRRRHLNDFRKPSLLTRFWRLKGN